MKALSELAREHAAIQALATRFERELAAARTWEIDATAIDRLIEFFEREVDGHHQEKEECVLLPRLLFRAKGPDLETLRRLAREHRCQRKVLAQMRNQVEGATYGEPISLAVLVTESRHYLHDQREHSRWEQRTLFPLAARILGPRDDRALRARFRRMDEVWGAPLWDTARTLAEWLDSRRNLVPC